MTHKSILETYVKTIYDDHNTSDSSIITCLTDRQYRFVNSLLHNSIVIGSGRAGTGKAQPLDSLVRVKNGWKRMGDIQIGDKVITPKGHETEVMGVYPQGEKDIIRITFDDGRVVECCDEHLWNVSHHNWKYEKTITAKEMKAYHDRTIGTPNHRKLSITTIDHEHKDDHSFTTEPYVVGTLLASDNENINAVVSRTESDEIIDTLLYEKSVPSEYIEWSSMNQKLDLIKGFMDTAGDVDDRGNTTIMVDNKKLKDDITYIIHSIGGKAYTKEENSSYVISVKYHTPRDLFTASEKSEKLPLEAQQHKKVFITEIEYIADKKECQCIYVEDKDHLYITDNFIVTHNTFLSSRVAGLLYKIDKSYKNIILTRPNVEAGEKMGALPGELMEKYEPYMQPFEKGLTMQMGAEKFKTDLHRKIHPQPIGYMRGKTFDDSIILCDEAQNLTIAQVKLLCTRMGTNSKLFITGDSNQCDLKQREENGLSWLIRQIEGHRKNIPIIEFLNDDCVRSEECKMFLDMFDNEIKL